MPLINNIYFKFRNFFSHKYPKLYFFCEARKSIIKFFLAGCLGGLIGLIFLYIFHGLLKMEIVIATTLAFIFSFAIGFILQKFWTFRNSNQAKAINQFVLYFINIFICLFLNGYLMHLLVNQFFIRYLLSQIIVDLLIGIYNYLLYKFFIFKTDGYETDRSKKTT